MCCLGQIADGIRYGLQSVVAGCSTVSDALRNLLTAQNLLKQEAHIYDYSQCRVYGRVLHIHTETLLHSNTRCHPYASHMLHLTSLGISGLDGHFLLRLTHTYAFFIHLLDSDQRKSTDSIPLN